MSGTALFVVPRLPLIAWRDAIEAGAPVGAIIRKQAIETSVHPDGGYQYRRVRKCKPSILK